MCVVDPSGLEYATEDLVCVPSAYCMKQCVGTIDILSLLLTHIASYLRAVSKMLSLVAGRAGRPSLLISKWSVCSRLNMLPYQRYC